MERARSSALQRASDGKPGRIRIAVSGWPLPMLAAVCAAVFVGQWFVQGGPTALALSAEALREGRWYTLITSMFVHAGLYHYLANFSVALGFDSVVERFGRRLSGRLLFLSLYLICGIAGGLLFVALQPHGGLPVVGASGAISGLWGAACRFPRPTARGGGGPMLPLFSRQVFAHAQGFLASNAILIGIFWFSSLASGAGVLLIAWEAHLGGFLAGLVLIGPFVRLAGAGQTWDNAVEAVTP